MTQPVENPHSFVISTDQSDLIEVEVETKQGSRYVYPDVSLDSIKQGLPESGRIPKDVTFLMFYNYSGATLSIPFHIVKEVRVGEDVLWTSPA